MVEIHPLRITKGQLDAAPDDERLTYLMAGNLANDVHILQKLLIASSHTARAMGHLRSPRQRDLPAPREAASRPPLRGLELAAERCQQPPPSSPGAGQDERGVAELRGYFGRDNLVDTQR